MWRERELRELASTQYGLLHREQLLAHGISDYEIGGRVSTGRIETIHPGVYYLNCTPATWKTEVLAATFASGADALASHRTAAILYGFDAIYGRVIEVTVPYVESPEPDGAIVHRTRRINPGSTLEGIPIVPPEKALLDIASQVPLRTLEKAMRSAVFNGTTSCDKISQAISQFGGRGVHGTKKCRSAVRLVADDQSGSVAEIDLRHIVDEAAVPKAIQQLRVRLPDGSNAYPDFAWPDRMRIVEVDGFGAHGAPQQLQADLRRQNYLMELGWELRRFTATEIREEPERVRAEITRFILKPFS
jgi:hypothetical protein